MEPDTTTSLQREIQTLSSRNAKLSQLLKASRDKLKDLSAQAADRRERGGGAGAVTTGRLRRRPGRPRPR